MFSYGQWAYTMLGECWYFIWPAGLDSQLCIAMNFLFNILLLYHPSRKLLYSYQRLQLHPLSHSRTETTWQESLWHSLSSGPFSQWGTGLAQTNQPTNNPSFIFQPFAEAPISYSFVVGAAIGARQNHLLLPPTALDSFQTLWMTTFTQHQFPKIVDSEL